MFVWKDGMCRRIKKGLRLYHSDLRLLTAGFTHLQVERLATEAFLKGPTKLDAFWV